MGGLRFLAALVFTASLVVAALVLTAQPAKAAWSSPQAMDGGSGPKLRLDGDDVWMAYARGDSTDPSAIVISAGNEPLTTVRPPRAGRVVAYDVSGSGRPTVIREVPSNGRRRLVSWLDGRWAAVSGRSGSAVDAKLAVAASGAAVLAWLQYEERRVYVHVARRAPAASRFSVAERISGPVRRGGQTLAVAVDEDGRAVAAFTEKRDLWIWRPGATTRRVHDATGTTASAFAAAAAVRREVAAVAFTRLEDLEPPQYRLSVGTTVGDAAPVVETVAADVSALDVAVAVAPDGAPLALSSPIGPPHLLRLHRRADAWSEAATFPAAEAPSTIAHQDGCVIWTEGTSGFAAIDSQKLTLGRAYNPDCAVGPDGRAVVVWDRGGVNRAQRIATFTP